MKLFGTYKKHKQNIGLLFMIMALALIFTGCSQTATPPPEANKEAQNSGQSTEQQQAETEEIREIEHAMGTTPVKGTPQRVVVLTNEGTEALLSLGVTPVGAANSWTGDPWYEHIKDKMEGVTPVGTESQVNLEAIIALKPDLILGTKMRHEKVYQQLSAIAPTVMSETIRGRWQINFDLYAKAVNKEAEAKQVMADFDNRISELREKLGDKVSTEVSLVRFMPGRTRIIYNDTFAGVILKEIGLSRPAVQDKDAFTDEVTKERIPEMEGDIMFYYVYETGDGEGSKVEQEWLNDPLFQNLNVVKNGRAFRVDDNIWNTAGGVLAANLMIDDLYKYFIEQ